MSPEILYTQIKSSTYDKTFWLHRGSYQSEEDTCWENGTAVTEYVRATGIMSKIPNNISVFMIKKQGINSC